MQAALLPIVAILGFGVLAVDVGMAASTGPETCLSLDAFRDPEATLNTCKLLTEKPNSANEKQTAKIWLQVANANYFLDRADEALSAVNTSLKLDPAAPTALVRRANVWGMEGRLPNSMADIDAAIKLDPSYPPAYVALGNVYKLLRRNERALAAYDEAIRLDPEYYFAFYARAELLPPNEGREALAQLLKVDRTKLERVPFRQQKVTRHRSFYKFVADKMISYLLHFKEFEQAIAMQEALLKEFPGEATDVARLAHIFNSQRNFGDALKTADEAIQINPLCPCGYREKMTAYWQSERLLDAYAAADQFLASAAEVDDKSDILILRSTIKRYRKANDEAYADALQAAEMSTSSLLQLTQRIQARGYLSHEPTGKVDDLFKDSLKACMLDEYC